MAQLVQVVVVVAQLVQPVVVVAQLVQAVGIVAQHLHAVVKKLLQPNLTKNLFYIEL